MQQYTIRGVPKEVDRVLRQKAEQRGVSLNQVILNELTLATVRPSGKGRFHGCDGGLGSGRRL